MKSFSTFIENRDIFADPVVLNFKGRDKYQTIKGGFWSIVAYILVLWLSFELLQRWVTHDEPIISTYEKFATPDQSYDLKEYNYRVYMSMTSNG